MVLGGPQKKVCLNIGIACRKSQVSVVGMEGGHFPAVRLNQYTPIANLVFYLDDGSTFTHTIEGETTTIRRHPDSVVVLEFPSVSGHHASIEQREVGYYILDHK